MKQSQLIAIAIAATTLLSTFVSNAQDSTWYVKSALGLSLLSDQSGEVDSVLGQTGNTDINTDGGFNAGVAAGYFIDENWAVELYWEYRTNDSETMLPGGVQFTDGNFASSVFAANAYYYTKNTSDWRWFAGAGLAVVQEIDIDLEDQTGERSFSGSGDIGFQVFTGVDYALDDNWSAQAEIRYLNVSGIDMTAEENVLVGSFQNIDYTPLSVQLNLIYTF